MTKALLHHILILRPEEQGKNKLILSTTSISQLAQTSRLCLPLRFTFITGSEGE